jgi:hypothetical protein
MAIPDHVQRKLSDNVWRRPNEMEATAALARLGISAANELADFFRRFRGPFSSRSFGHELLDLVDEQEESIPSSTEAARKEFALPNRFLVVSTLCGLSVLVYDAESGAVYDVDFEGGDELLKAGQLPARWQSWNAFISDYFA